MPHCARSKANEKAKQDAASIQKLQNELVAQKQQCETEKKKISGDGAKVAAECQAKNKATEAEPLACSQCGQSWGVLFVETGSILRKEKLQKLQ